jgi:HAE1 family hydrophobic/amphiphilic exporter-1
MREVTGAVIATSLVLVAVFGPVAFLSGTTGRLYRQFSLTIAFAVAISAFNALTLSPALAALLMRARQEDKDEKDGKREFVVFRWFNLGYKALYKRYCKALSWQLRHLGWAAGAFVAGLALTLLVFRSVPTSFVPDEDQNYIIVQVIGPKSRTCFRCSVSASPATAQTALSSSPACGRSRSGRAPSIQRWPWSPTCSPSSGPSPARS